MLRVGYLQFRPQFGGIKRNLSVVLKALAEVKADLIVLPELAFTGYFFANREEAMALAEDPQNSNTVAALIELCRRRELYLVTGFTERKHDKLFNSSLLIGPGGLLHTYRKLHLFNTEKQVFDAGDTPLSVQEIRGARVGMMVCYDWAFPEVTRTLALQGADIIAQPANLVLGFCQQTMLTRSLENWVFAVTANRFGTDKRPHGEVTFTGRSQIVAPGGALVHRAASKRQCLHIAEIDPTLARNKAITARNDLLRDRRPEFYQALTQS